MLAVSESVMKRRVHGVFRCDYLAMKPTIRWVTQRASLVVVAKGIQNLLSGTRCCLCWKQADVACCRVLAAGKKTTTRPVSEKVACVRGGDGDRDWRQTSQDRTPWNNLFDNYVHFLYSRFSHFPFSYPQQLSSPRLVLYVTKIDQLLFIANER